MKKTSLRKFLQHLFTKSTTPIGMCEVMHQASTAFPAFPAGRLRQYISQIYTAQKLAGKKQRVVFRDDLSLCGRNTRPGVRTRLKPSGAAYVSSCAETCTSAN